MKPFLAKEDRKNIAWFWKKYLKSQSVWIFTILILICAQALIYQQFLKFTETGLRIIFENGQIRDLLEICLVICGAFLLRAAISYIIPAISANLAGTALHRLRTELTHHLVYMEQIFFDKTASADIILKLVNQVQAISQFVARTLVWAIRDLVTVVVISAYLIYKSPILFAAACIVLPVIFFIIQNITSRIKSIQKATENNNAKYINSIDELNSGMRTVKMTRQEKAEIDRLTQGSERLRKLSIKLLLTQVLVYPAIDLSSALVFLIVIGGGGYMVISPNFAMDGADIIAFILGLVIIFDPAKAVSQFFPKFQSNLVHLESVREILKGKNEKDLEQSDSEFSNHKITAKIENVSFSYVEDENILNNLTMCFKNGEKSAIVGATGSGKTSIINLLTRLYEPDTGGILFNNRDIRNFSRESIRRQFSVVAQDIIIFNKSIRENILYARPESSDTAILEAARKADIDQLMITRGHEPVGPRGSQLSGGQKQRIAVARAFLNPAPILILDEATSALDSLTEEKIHRSFSELQKERTTIIVTHKFVNVEDADIIFVLEKGRLVEKRHSSQFNKE